jgi:hypothetical protein
MGKSTANIHKKEAGTGTMSAGNNNTSRNVHIKGRATATPVVVSKKNVKGGYAVPVLCALMAVLVPLAMYYITKTSHTIPILTTARTAAGDLAAKVPLGANPDGKPREAVPGCVDRHKQCAGFARNNACVETPG